MINLTIDNQSLSVAPGTTILEAAKQLNISIPTLCFLKKFEPSTSCLVCLVAIKGQSNLVPSCGALVQAGMEIITNSDEVIEARKNALSLLLSEHTGDCIAPCQRACPHFINIPLMIRHIQNYDFDQARAVIGQASDQSPETLCEQCKKPCETVCRRKNIDETISIGHLIKAAGEYCQTVVGAYGNTPLQVDLEKKRFSSFIRNLSKEELELFAASASSSQRRQPTDTDFSAEEAALESKRCLHCDCIKQNNCQLRDRAEELQAKQATYRGDRLPFEQVINNHYIFESGKCIKCGICTKICQNAGIQSGFTFLKRGFDTKIGVPFNDYDNQELITVIQDCIDKCPTGAISKNDRLIL